MSGTWLQYEQNTSDFILWRNVAREMLFHLSYPLFKKKRLYIKIKQDKIDISQNIINMSYGATVGASAANSNLIEFKK